MELLLATVTLGVKKPGAHDRRLRTPNTQDAVVQPQPPNGLCRLASAAHSLPWLASSCPLSTTPAVPLPPIRNTPRQHSSPLPAQPSAAACCCRQGHRPPQRIGCLKRGRARVNGHGLDVAACCIRQRGLHDALAQRAIVKGHARDVGVQADALAGRGRQTNSQGGHPSKGGGGGGEGAVATAGPDADVHAGSGACRGSFQRSVLIGLLCGMQSRWQGQQQSSRLERATEQARSASNSQLLRLCCRLQPRQLLPLFLQLRLLLLQRGVLVVSTCAQTQAQRAGHTMHSTDNKSAAGMSVVVCALLNDWLQARWRTHAMPLLLWRSLCVHLHPLATHHTPSSSTAATYLRSFDSCATSCCTSAMVELMSAMRASCCALASLYTANASAADAFCVSSVNDGKASDGADGAEADDAWVVAAGTQQRVVVNRRRGVPLRLSVDNVAAAALSSCAAANTLKHHQPLNASSTQAAAAGTQDATTPLMLAATRNSRSCAILTVVSTMRRMSAMSAASLEL